MVSERANRGCSFVQELQRRDFQSNVPNARSGFIQFYGTHAATPADSHGIYGPKGGDGAFRRRPRGAGGASLGRQTHHPIPGTSHHRFWLDRSSASHVHFEQTSRSAYDFPLSPLITYMTLHARGLSIFP